MNKNIIATLCTMPHNRIVFRITYIRNNAANSTYEVDELLDGGVNSCHQLRGVQLGSCLNTLASIW